MKITIDTINFEIILRGEIDPDQLTAIMSGYKFKGYKLIAVSDETQHQLCCNELMRLVEMATDANYYHCNVCKNIRRKVK